MKMLGKRLNYITLSSVSNEMNENWIYDAFLTFGIYENQNHNGKRTFEYNKIPA